MNFIYAIFEWTFHLNGWQDTLWRLWVGFQIIAFMYFLIGPVVMNLNFNWYTKKIHIVYHYVACFLWICLFILIGYIGYLNYMDV